MSASENEKEQEQIYAPCSKRQRLCDYSPELFSSPDRTISDGSGSPIFLSNSDECDTSYTIDPSYFSRNECFGDGELNSTNLPIESEAESHVSTIGAIYPSDISDMYESDSEDAEANNKVLHYLNATDTPNSQRDDELHEVGAILVSKCCVRNCLFHLTAHDVIKARKKFSSLGVNAKRQWLMDRIHENSHESAQGILHTKYTVAGQEICQFAWCKVHEVSPTRVRRMLKSVSFGQIRAEHGNKGNRRVNTKSDNAKAWMQRYFHLVGDKMPHNNQIHLPSWERRRDVYDRYTEDMTLQDIPKIDLVCLSMFYKIWNDNFANVVIPEVSQGNVC